MQVQIILFMAFNVVMFIYFLIFRPSLFKVTNRINIFICLCFLGIEIALFVYTITTKTT